MSFLVPNGSSPEFGGRQAIGLGCPDRSSTFNH
jgi:hypothetical protein